MGREKGRFSPDQKESHYSGGGKLFRLHCHVAWLDRTPDFSGSAGARFVDQHMATKGVAGSQRPVKVVQSPGQFANYKHRYTFH